MPKRLIPRDTGPFKGRFGLIYNRIRKVGYPAQSAKVLTDAQKQAQEAGVSFEWLPDPDGSEEAGETLWVVMAIRDEDDSVIHSLGDVPLQTEPDAHHSDLFQYMGESDVWEMCLQDNHFIGREE